MNQHHGPTIASATPTAVAVCAATTLHGAPRRAVHSTAGRSTSDITVVPFASRVVPASRPSATARLSVAPSLRVSTSKYRIALYIAIASASLLTIDASYDTCG